MLKRSHNEVINIFMNKINPALTAAWYLGKADSRAAPLSHTQGRLARSKHPPTSRCRALRVQSIRDT